MARHFEVVGQDVMGDVMGYEDEYGDMVVSGPRSMGRGKRNMVQVVQPAWRRNQMAPGVQVPDEGVIPLPLVGEGGTNIFTATTQQIIFRGDLQKPFRAERMLVSVVRTGATAIGRVLGQIFVGTDLQQADINGIDIEQLGDPGAFGVRLTMAGAVPGIAIRLACRLSSPLTAADTIQCNIQMLGRAVF